MGIKYNSLKEALPSLLVEERTLNERISQLEGQITKIDSDIENLDAQSVDLEKKTALKKERIARAEQIIATKERQRKREIVIRGLKVVKMMKI